MGTAGLRPVKRVLSVVVLPLSMLLLAAPARAAEPVFPRGSHVGIVPPPGFDLSAQFMGFEDRRTGASIAIYDMPKDAYPAISASFGQEEQLRARGMTLLGSCKTVNVTHEHRCFRVSQAASGLMFRKWILVANLDHGTTMVVANVPEVALTNKSLSADEMEAALSSMTYSHRPATRPVDALPFIIEEGSLLTFQRAMGGSAAVYVGQAAEGTLRPLWIVAASLNASPQARESDFSRRAFGDISTVSGAQVLQERPVTVGPLTGHVLEGSGRSEASGDALFVFQAILVDGRDRYYRLVGLAPAGQKDRYRPEFLRLMRTLRPR